MLYWPFSAHSIQRTPYDPKALFIRKKEKLVPGRRVTRLPELPWASQHFLHLLILVIVDTTAAPVLYILGK